MYNTTKEVPDLYPHEFINAVLQKNPIQEVVKKYVSLKPIRGLLYGLCPLEPNSSTYSLVVDPKQQTCQCMSCGLGGNAIEFTMHVQHCNFDTAVQYLAGPNIIAPDTEPLRTQHAKKSQLLANINRHAARHYHYQLYKADNPGLQYFKQRGLSESTIKKFGLGMSYNYGHGLYQYLSRLGFQDDDLLSSGLIGFGHDYQTGKDAYYDKFWDRVMFPIIDANSQVIGFGGRVLGDAKPKYLNTPETVLFDKGANLYGYHIAQHTQRDSFILCEGYMDTISMHQAGFDNAVASLGTALTERQADLIAGKVHRVYLAYDGDMPGVKAALRALPILESRGLTVGILTFGTCKDPDEYIQKNGAKAFEELMKNAESSEHFKFRAYEMQCGGYTEEYFDIASELLMQHLEGSKK